jgi:hypothetical protein
MQITVQKISFDTNGLTAESTVTDFANYVLSTDPELADVEVVEMGEWCYASFLYTLATKDDIYETAGFYKNENCFWLVTFICLVENRETLGAAFPGYAETVTFATAD